MWIPTPKSKRISLQACESTFCNVLKCENRFYSKHRGLMICPLLLDSNLFGILFKNLCSGKTFKVIYEWCMFLHVFKKFFLPFLLNKWKTLISKNICWNVFIILKLRKTALTHWTTGGKNFPAGLDGKTLSLQEIKVGHLEKHRSYENDRPQRCVTLEAIFFPLTLEVIF